jgi:general secretion pathway protein F
MPRFAYTAIDADGNLQQGDTLAPDHDGAILWIQQQGLMPVSARLHSQQSVALEKEKAFSWRNNSKVGDTERILFIKALLTMLQAGLPLDKSLKVLERRESNPMMRQRQTEMLAALKHGQSFTDAAHQTGLFEEVHLAQFRAGEATGRLTQALETVENYLERSHALNSQVKSALVYPMILCLVTLLSLLLIFILVVPKIATLFADAQVLPLSTEIVIGISEFLNVHGFWLLLFALFLILLVSIWYKDDRRRLNLASSLLNVPVLGQLLIHIESARFCRCLASLLSAGMPLLKSLDYSFSAIANPAMAAQLSNCSEAVKSGERLADALDRMAMMPALSIQLISVGENSGALPAMLQRVADVLDSEVESRLQRFLSILEPTLVIGLGIMIGGIILSILSAIVSVNELSF